MEGPGFESQQQQNSCLSQIIQTGSENHLDWHFFHWRQSGRGVRLAIHLRLLQRLRMRGATSLLPLYAFAECIETNLPLLLQPDNF
jgi:hypothetical protein